MLYHFIKDIGNVINTLYLDFKSVTTKLKQYHILWVLLIITLTILGCLWGKTVLNAYLSDLNYSQFKAIQDTSPYY